MPRLKPGEDPPAGRPFTFMSYPSASIMEHHIYGLIELRQAGRHREKRRHELTASARIRRTKTTGSRARTVLQHAAFSGNLSHSDGGGESLHQVRRVDRKSVFCLLFHAQKSKWPRTPARLDAVFSPRPNHLIMKSVGKYKDIFILTYTKSHTFVAKSTFPVLSML